METTLMKAKYATINYPNTSNAFCVFEKNRKEMIENWPLEEINIYSLGIEDFVVSISQLIERFGQQKVLEVLWEDIHKYLYIFPEIFYDTMNLFSNELWYSIMGITEPIIS